MTYRENIDPVNARTDAELNSYLQLVHADPAASPALKNKLRLDGEVAHEGSNFSAGERQLSESSICTIARMSNDKSRSYVRS